MDDFVAFDNDSNCFIDETKCILKDGTLFRDDEAYIDMISDDLSMFFGIGKTDIEGKMIYADSSIVELKITFDIGKTFEILTGYFRYCNDGFCYEFIEPFENNTTRRKWNYSKIHIQVSELRIIGTLQEDKEFLK